MKHALKIIAVLIFLPLAVSFAAQERDVRVAIAQGAGSVGIKIKGLFEIKDLEKDKVIHRAKSLNTTVTTSRDGINFGLLKSGSGRLFIHSDDPEAIMINGRIFRGNMEFIRTSENKLLVVNYVGLEPYIQGILYHEISHYWPQEALEAQAIISRTYALYQLQENSLKDFDLTSDIYSQVYGGQTSERYRTNKAVEATKGKVLFYQGRLIPSYFHATCGGHTEEAAELWNINLAPLRGVVCGFCKDSPHFNWHGDLKLKTIEEALAAGGFKIKDIKSIDIESRDRSGRITNLMISSGAKTIKIPAKDFRSLIGPNIIKSTNFSVNVVNHDAVFEGVGWGHGVGLCQWGAYLMSKQGSKAEEILKYYYPGIDVKTL